MLLDDRGALVDLLPCGQLSGNIPKSGKSVLDVFTDERKRKDVGRIKDKILDKVGRVCVGGAGSRTRSLTRSVGWGVGGQDQGQDPDRGGLGGD